MKPRYLPHLEISLNFAIRMPNNCAVIERTVDGVSVGPCTYYLKDGIECPRHGVVIENQPVIEGWKPDA